MDSIIIFIQKVLYQINFLWPYWFFGVLLGGIISNIPLAEKVISFINKKKYPGILLTSLGSFAGVVSPFCMFGAISIMIPFKQKGLPLSVIFAFLISSSLMNPNLFIFSFILGYELALARLFSAIILGIIAGVIIKFLIKSGIDPGINFDKLAQKILSKKKENKCKLQQEPKFRLGSKKIKQITVSVYKLAKFTGFYFLIGLSLTALVDMYFPEEIFFRYLGYQNPLAIIFAAGMGIPIYMCGGGTLPLIRSWLWAGMSPGAALAFLISGQATKVKYLVAYKSVLNFKSLVFLIAYLTISSIIIGYFFNFISTPWVIN